MEAIICAHVMRIQKRRCYGIDNDGSRVDGSRGMGNNRKE
jgi:hypothetical protein